MLTSSLIHTPGNHGRFIPLTIGMVGNIAQLLIAGTIDPCPREVLKGTYCILGSYIQQTAHQSVDTIDLSWSSISARSHVID